jgi:nitrite reductase (NO-forming)
MIQVNRRSGDLGWIPLWFWKPALAFLILFIYVTIVYADPPVETAILTSPPLLPPPILRDHPAKVIVELEVVEKVMQIADGVDYTFWTFGGTVPGKFIRVRVGDTVELHFSNHADSKVPHNIDLHAVTGPGGGAPSTFTAPGHQTVFTFKALNPGLYVYHCATAPVGMHIANGMYGLIYVQPETPLPAVDREFYVMQGDFYTDQPFGVKGHQPFSMKRAIDENPSYVVFNGSALSMTGENALKARVGETVRLYIGNGGPNLVSSFHVIGEIFDRVYTEGGSKFQENVQTTLIPAGGAAMIEFKLDTKGSYFLVDHSIFRAFNKGSLGMLKVEGEREPTIYAGTPPGRPKSQSRPAVKSRLEVKEAWVGPGKVLYERNCAFCHQPEGEGMVGTFPPLAKADYLQALAEKTDRAELIRIPLFGLTGKITVNGSDYYGEMPPISGMSDQDLATVLTYTTNSWGNHARPFTAAEVKKVRDEVPRGPKVEAHPRLALKMTGKGN